MYDPMIKVANKYLNIALQCDTVILATFLHPAWRMMLFTNRFDTHILRINDLIKQVFDARSDELKANQPPTTPPTQVQTTDNSSSDSDSDGNEFNYYPINSQATEENTELERYNKGNFPMDKKGKPLDWWKPARQPWNEPFQLQPMYVGLKGVPLEFERLKGV
ncbi:hypothetical protein PGTUg99_010363 [Puccinia graminis f. sp. tritici]|uniref:HAT C-terminal dimerisation domain-containing protein n=1 Tax=Puccinia graminis f. sp. tritici TaxID=56615 RepID=A0A5B0S3B6_PUCGR|nr:hypothetical protein PGTUg99_010363 [Puccinia graminis f. sp. tritici]